MVHESAAHYLAVPPAQSHLGHNRTRNMTSITYVLADLMIPFPTRILALLLY